MSSFTRTADGDIYPMRFTTIVGISAEGRVLQAVAGSRPYGISQVGARRVDYIDSTGRAAIAGEDLNIHGPPEKDVLLQINGTVTRGDFLKPDATGMGITTTTQTDIVGAVAMVSGVAGQAILVEVIAPMQL